jgi:hypothetical protein
MARRTVSVLPADSSAVLAARSQELASSSAPLPLSKAPELKSGEFQNALRHILSKVQCFGLAILPLNALTMQCGCGSTLHRSDTDNGMRCSALAAQFTLRHDILKGILCGAVHRAGLCP